MDRSRLQSASWQAQALALRGMVWLLQRLGPHSASNLGGWLARNVGPFLAASRVADENLRRSLPELGAAERKRTIRGVWDNLGRTAAELPHLAGLTATAHGAGWELSGREHIAELLATGQQALFFSGHFGNWEMILPIAAQLGLRIAGIYRPASNAPADAVIQALRQRALGPRVSMFAKGAPGARAALRHLERGGSLGLLVDQKMNDGLAVPFFGRPAMTAPALAHFALRRRCPVIPVRVERLGAARFRMVCEAPLAIPDTGSKQGDVFALTMGMNATLERWIRADPCAWLWLHRRWPKPSQNDAA